MAKTDEIKRKWIIRKECIYDIEKFYQGDYLNSMEILYVKDFFGTYSEAKTEEQNLLSAEGFPKDTIFYASVFETKEIKRPEIKKKKKELENG